MAIWQKWNKNDKIGQNISHVGVSKSTQYMLANKTCINLISGNPVAYVRKRSASSETLPFSFYCLMSCALLLLHYCLDSYVRLGLPSQDFWQKNKILTRKSSSHISLTKIWRCGSKLKPKTWRCVIKTETLPWNTGCPANIGPTPYFDLTSVLMHNEFWDAVCTTKNTKYRKFPNFFGIK